jgi:hypothetical protein
MRVDDQARLIIYGSRMRDVGDVDAPFERRIVVTGR